MRTCASPHFARGRWLTGAVLSESIWFSQKPATMAYLFRKRRRMCPGVVSYLVASYRDDSEAGSQLSFRYVQWLVAPNRLLVLCWKGGVDESAYYDLRMVAARILIGIHGPIMDLIVRGFPGPSLPWEHNMMCTCPQKVCQAPCGLLDIWVLTSREAPLILTTHSRASQLYRSHSWPMKTYHGADRSSYLSRYRDPGKPIERLVTKFGGCLVLALAWTHDL